MAFNKKELFIHLEKYKEPEKALQIEAYMRNQFEFLGIQAGKRKELTKSFLDNYKKEESVDWGFLSHLFNHTYREFQYIGSDYLNSMQKKLVPEDLPRIKELALTKPWWDTIDSIDKVIGRLALKYPEFNTVLIEWSLEDSIWLRRIAINHQRHRKDLMDKNLLETIISNNLNDTEFFINKAIGWILRDYSKTNPEWVSHFIETHKENMHPLSIREGNKYLNRRKT
ncbi:DNA alkylation repair protein [Alkalibacterium iburiense]|uniref:DNA alkylation repair protein n=1 Tax=Alkalibacterium iburiense TaxID=290589 RepID=A0ABP3HLU9_9LACT